MSDMYSILSRYIHLEINETYENSTGTPPSDTLNSTILEYLTQLRHITQYTKRIDDKFINLHKQLALDPGILEIHDFTASPAVYSLNCLHPYVYLFFIYFLFYCIYIFFSIQIFRSPYTRK